MKAERNILFQTDGKRAGLRLSNCPKARFPCGGGDLDQILQCPKGKKFCPALEVTP